MSAATMAWVYSRHGRTPGIEEASYEPERRILSTAVSPGCRRRAPRADVSVVVSGAGGRRGEAREDRGGPGDADAGGEPHLHGAQDHGGRWIVRQRRSVWVAGRRSEGADPVAQAVAGRKRSARDRQD